MNDARLGYDDEPLRRIVLAIRNHLFRRANRVGQVAHFAQTFGMNDHLGVREFFTQSQHLIALELHVRITVAVPKRHRAAGLFHHPRAEIFVRDEQQVLVLRRGLDDFHRVAAGANHVAQRLHRRAAIDVGDGPEIRVGLLQRGQLVRRTAFFERTAGVLVRQHDDFVRVQNLRRLGHEMHAAENNHVRVGFGRLLGKAERIAHEIRHVLDFRHLVIVGEDDGVELFFERKNLLCQRLECFLRHRAARMDFCDINHARQVTARTGGVNFCRWHRRPRL